MKRLITVLAILSAFIFGAGNVGADIVFNYPDTYFNWPGYPQPPYPVVNVDQYGAYPTISGAIITVDDNFYLKSINILDSILQGTETLFINTKWAKGTAYDQWDYLAGPYWYDPNAPFYSVKPSFTPADYILVTIPEDRYGHPFSINASKLDLLPGYLQGISYDGANLVYTFNQGMIQLYDANTGFVVGVSENCGNDVFLTPVPEPITLLMLGFGIVGVWGIRRKVS